MTTDVLTANLVVCHQRHRLTDIPCLNTLGWFEGRTFVSRHRKREVQVTGGQIQVRCEECRQVTVIQTVFCPESGAG